MTIFDQIFYFVFSKYKKQYKQKANNIALYYTSLLQITIAFLLGCFFAAFFSNMHVNAMSSDKAWILFVMLSIGIHFKNWITYNGNTRKVMNAKFNKKKSPKYNISLLIALPFICIAMGLILLQSL
ncbi:hypothetical protein CLV86_1052 [Lacinutrix venerupis]|uniref:hypothetical protein n=1 Tax=Lacinutrix venerupis TaxID=1486034 RepID=UPI000EAEF1B2|nr:hypothetical protein [Lacinutrix venerupis]RLJ65476.1 hypothetical protein CLV86_1052 [Lacinutrix venerupis]